MLAEPVLMIPMIENGGEVIASAAGYGSAGC
jgi:hypothetical protein